MAAQEDKTQDKPAMILEAVTEAPVTVGDMPSVPVEVTPIQVEGKVQGNSLWLVWVVVAFLAGAALGGGGGYMVWGKKMEATPQIVESAPTGKPAPTAVTSVAPTVAPKRSEIKIKVLNGSGVAGGAGKAKEFLLNLGYKNVDTGNADREDYEKTEISVKASFKANGELLKADLGSKYSVEMGSSDVAETDSYDAVIIIGLK